MGKMEKMPKVITSVLSATNKILTGFDRVFLLYLKHRKANLTHFRVEGQGRFR